MRPAKFNQNRYSAKWLSIFLVLSSTGLIAAQDLRWDVRPEIVPYVGHELSWNEKAELALVASGVAAESVPAYTQKISAIAEAAKSKFGTLIDYDKGDQILQFLYSQKILVRYEALQTKIDVALDRGIYNCVSSALVYYLVADYLGLKLQAIGTRDHAFCVVLLADQEVDVETTTYLGFDPGKKREFHDSFGKLTGFSYVPASNYRDRTRLDFKGLVGLLIQNLMAAAQDRGDQATPFGLSIDRLALENSADARSLVDLSFKNYVSDLGQRKNYDKALSALDEYDSKNGTAAVSSELRLAIVNNKLVDLMRANQTAQVRAMLARYATFLGPANARQFWEGLVNQESSQVYSQQGVSAALGAVDQSQNKGEIDKSYADQLRLQFISRELNNFGRSNKWQEAWNFLNGLPADAKANPQIADLIKTVSRNVAIDYHNKFAALMNQGKTAEAGAILSEALLKVPDSDILQRDKAAITK